MSSDLGSPLQGTVLIVDVEVAEEPANDSSISKSGSSSENQGQHLVDEAIKRGAKIVE